MKEAVTDVMIKKAQSISMGAEILAQNTSDWQIIKSYLKNRLGEMELTAIQQDKLKRYQFVFNQMSGFRHSENEVVNQLKVQFGIKLAQAYEDLANAKELYAFVFDLNKAFEVRVMLEANAVMLYKAKEMNDGPTYAKLEKNRIELTKMIQEAEQNVTEDFKPHTLVVQFDPVLIGADPNLDMKAMMDYINDKRGAKINTQKFDDAEVVEDGSEPAL